MKTSFYLGILAGNCTFLLRLILLVCMVSIRQSLSYGQILNNSTKMPDKSVINSRSPVSAPETLSVTPATITALKNAVAVPETETIRFGDTKQFIDTLVNEIKDLVDTKDTLDEINQKLQKSIVNKVSAEKYYQETKVKNDIKNRLKGLDSLLKIEKAVNMDLERQHKTEYNAAIKLVRIQSTVNKVALSISKKLRSIDSTMLIPDSLGIMLEKLMPELRNKIIRNTFLVNNMHTLFDSSHNAKKRIALIDSLSQIDASYSEIAEDNSILKSRASDAVRLKKAIVSRVKSFLMDIDDGLKAIEEQASSDIGENIIAYTEMLELNKGRFTKIEVAVKDELIPELSKLSIERKEIMLQYISFVEKFSRASEELRNLQKNNINLSPKKKSDEMDFGALPNLTQLIGENRAPNLNISVVGSFSSISDTINSTFETRIFTANLPVETRNAKAIFVPEQSTFGVQVKYSLGWETRTRFGRNAFLNHRGVNLEINLLNKKILDESQFTADDDLTNFMAHLKGGFEQVVVRDRMSVYANVSWLGLVDNVTNFRKQYDQFLDTPKKSTFWFGDFGARFLLLPSVNNFSSAGDLQIFSDINFILPGTWGNSLMQTDDKIMTLVKIGFKKSLGVIHRTELK